MDALLLSGQVIALCALPYGCYLCIANWHLSDHAGVEREFRAGSGLQPSAKRYDPMSDQNVAAEAGFLL